MSRRGNRSVKVTLTFDWAEVETVAAIGDYAVPPSYTSTL